MTRYLSKTANIWVFKVWVLYYILLVGEKPNLAPILPFFGRFYMLEYGETNKGSPYYVVSTGCSNLVIGDGWISTKGYNPRFLSEKHIPTNNWYKKVLTTRLLSLTHKIFNYLANTSGKVK